MKIFLDANILFLASHSDSSVRRLVKDLSKNSCLLAVDGYVLEEALRNLSVHQPAAVPALHELVTLLTTVPTCRYSPELPSDIHLPDKDIPVLSTAVDARCDILMTGDSRHFGELFGRTIGGVTIRSPIETARVVLGSRS